jgi:predicted nuclease of restriction endonuclease-like (RecB) superfamily
MEMNIANSKDDKRKPSNPYNNLLANIGNILEEGRKQAFYAVNSILVKTYWGIGKGIVEYEQEGKERAEYGSALLDSLSRDLKQRYGKGFSRRNVLDMRRFYLNYPNWQTVSAELSWSHYVELLEIEDSLERSFYERQAANEKWSVRELSRQINSALFHRIALSKDKKGVLELSKKGLIAKDESDIVKDPYILEFLKVPENYKLSEKELEQKIIDNLQMFLLELGKGFTFVKRQFRITLDNNNYYVDLVFYHRILKCFVLIDLKIGKVNHNDFGQMNMYLNYFKEEENSSEDNKPIGIILSAEKNNLLVKYALGGISNNLFVSKYRLYLPDKKELEFRLKSLLS